MRSIGNGSPVGHQLAAGLLNGMRPNMQLLFIDVYNDKIVRNGRLFGSSVDICETSSENVVKSDNVNSKSMPIDIVTL